MADPERVKVLRERLCSVSKFMGSLCEQIARERRTRQLTMANLSHAALEDLCVSA